ncbi:serine/threonine protein phosphatase [Sphingomonas yunnanensis]|uniref:metallophosphoesterase family protein n=1 Tax=Sphingomonas yunnanensis TaxID=310400 RepID=UPI001CA62B96|nr:metallophosphoesterase family protein [Sphingomonas yunnanensis]MBY9061368.1 serine/threonine protein phosphatase [Sphingomonas yunnanensis]
MLSKFLRPSRPAPAASPSVASGERLYAIGDVHGCRDELERLLALVDADDAARGGAQTSLIFLGDLVDRGPDSAGAVARLLDLARERPSTRFLKGNHEEVFLLALAGDREALRLFCRVGGRETLMSYGLSRQDYDALDYDALAERLPALVPVAHRDFLDGFEDLVISGDYAFVHAGIRPEVPLDEQVAADLRWIRGSFLDYRRPHPKMIVHGHTITDGIDRRANRIGVDTGAYASGKLSALGLEGGESWTLQT